MSGGVFEPLARALRAGEPVALATVIDGPGRGAKLLVRPDAEAVGTLGDPDLDRVVARDARGELAAGATGVRHYGRRGEAREAVVAVFVESFAPPPRMLVFGAVDFTRALVRVAKVLGYQVTVCDPRAVFATQDRFPEADEVVVDWPDRLLGRVGPSLTERDAVCVLTHDIKLDVPALVAALRTDVGYIGAMGSRRTHAARLARLTEALAAADAQVSGSDGGGGAAGVAGAGRSGTDPEAGGAGGTAGAGDAAGLGAGGLDRIRAPVGLDIGARTPEETAVSICAEIITDRTGRMDVRPLRASTGPIHRPGP